MFVLPQLHVMFIIRVHRPVKHDPVCKQSQCTAAVHLVHKIGSFWHTLNYFEQLIWDCKFLFLNSAGEEPSSMLIFPSTIDSLVDFKCVN